MRGIRVKEQITQKQKETVFVVTGRIIGQLEEIRKNSSGKATLAKLRNSIGRPLSETVDVWPIVFEQIPQNFLSKSGYLTKEEKAILTTLQLYALHQQGQEKSTGKIRKKGEWDNIGMSLKTLRIGEDTAAIDRRFNTMITATTFEELSYHLRQLLRLLKAKQKEEKVNYAQLANDLYWFLNNKEENIRINWSKAYYSRRDNIERGEENNE